MVKILGRFVLVSVFFGVVVFKIQAAYNYGEVLQKSLYFYECQQSGPLPDWNRVAWRGPSCLNDGKDAGLDLTGGWFDAGDHVKFNFPMAASTTMLAWGGIDYKDSYVKSGQYAILQNNLRFVCDYLMRCHTGENEFYGQVGNGGLDHAFWGPAESVEAQMARPAYKIDASKPGSDLAGEAAAALASCAIVFKDSDPNYSQKLLGHAKSLYTFADTHRGKYPDAITDAQGYYNSFSGYQDELVWGAIWLYKATNDETYLAKAKKEYESLATEPQVPEKKYKWTIAWDDKSYGCYVLMAQITGDQQYHTDAQRWLDYWTSGYNGNKIKYTPGGLAWLDTWGPNRYAANTAFCAMLYSDKLENADLKKKYHDFAVNQVNYMLGDNPNNRSMVIGYGKNPPVRPHHRTCQGVFPGDASDTVASVHTLYGALVGGPGNDDSYVDKRNDYISNEVACDYNAAFTGLIARMYGEFGGDPLPYFPKPVVKEAEFWVEASINASGSRFTEVRSVIKNNSRWPAKVAETLKFRYYVDLSEVKAAGVDVGEVTVSTNYVEGKSIKYSQPQLLDGDIYYIEFDLTGEKLYPGTQNSYKREIQFRISLPNSAPEGAWDPSNDWSYKGMKEGYAAAAEIVNIPVFLGDKQVSGADYNKERIDLTPILNLLPKTQKNLNAISFSIVNNASQMLIQGNGNNHKVDIWTLSGKNVGRYNISSLPANINIEHFRPGSYLIRLRKTDGTVSQRTFIINR